MCGRRVCLCQRRVWAVALRARRENNGRSTVAESAGRNTPERGERARSGREKRAGRAPREKQKKRKTSKVSGVTGPMSIYILTMPTVLTHWDVVGGRARASARQAESRHLLPARGPQAQARAVPHPIVDRLGALSGGEGLRISLRRARAQCSQQTRALSGKRAAAGAAFPSCTPHSGWGCCGPAGPGGLTSPDQMCCGSRSGPSRR